MKRLAMVLAISFTMGLAASTVSASTRTDDKPKKECSEAQKKSCCADKKSCCEGKKVEKKAEAPAKK